jgi:lysophospholipase L1-like esterase
LENSLISESIPLRFRGVLRMVMRLAGGAILAGLVSLCCVEACLRAMGFPSGFARSIRSAYDLDEQTIGPFRAGAKVQVTWPPETAYEATFNSLGCRGPEPRDVDKPAILCVGDSLTFGLYVNDEETWPFQLDRRLQEEGLTRPVLNLSSGHLLPEDELYYIKRALDALDNVGIVILLLPSGGFIDPVDRLSETPHQKSKERELSRRNWFRRFYHDLAVYEARTLIRLWRGRLVAQSRQPGPVDFQFDEGIRSGISPELRERYHKEIAEIQAVVEENGALFVLASFPDTTIQGEEIIFETPWSAGIASDLGCPYVDIYQAFQAEEDKNSLLLLPYDLHASHKGNAVVAETVMNTLKKGGYLD